MTSESFMVPNDEFEIWGSNITFQVDILVRIDVIGSNDDTLLVESMGSAYI